jgi:formylglycine-generating enzyme required for sulfatase activity
LDKFVRGEKLNDLMVIKGGSWVDDPYFLQPGALYFQNKGKGQNNIGFRPIIRVVKP